MELKELRSSGGSRFAYGRAWVLEKGGNRYLKSFGTTVASVSKRGRVRRLWGGYTKTTAAHTLAFLRQEAPRPEGWTMRDFGSIPVSDPPKGLAFPERKRRR